MARQRQYARIIYVSVSMIVSLLTGAGCNGPRPYAGFGFDLPTTHGDKVSVLGAGRQADSSTNYEIGSISLVVQVENLSLAVNDETDQRDVLTKWVSDEFGGKDRNESDWLHHIQKRFVEGNTAHFMLSTDIDFPDSRFPAVARVLVGTRHVVLLIAHAGVDGPNLPDLVAFLDSMNAHED